jgi:hypothetical protein
LLQAKIARTVESVGLLAGLITGGAGFVLLLNPNGITEFLRRVSMSHESFLPATAFVQLDFVHGAECTRGFR